MEKWKWIPGFKGYYKASTKGRIKSFHKIPKILRQYKTYKYWNVRLYKKRKGKTYNVHKLILLTFRGPCPLGYMTRHLDDNKDNNRLRNLKYGTRMENLQDAIKNGRLGNTGKGADDRKERGVVKIEIAITKRLS